MIRLLALFLLGDTMKKFLLPLFALLFVACGEKGPNGPDWGNITPNPEPEPNPGDHGQLRYQGLICWVTKIG